MALGGCCVPESSARKKYVLPGGEKRLVGWQVSEVLTCGNCSGARAWKRLKSTVQRAPEAGV